MHITETLRAVSKIYDLKQLLSKPFIFELTTILYEGV